MAKNYTFAEVVKIINEGTDMESIIDIGRRFPVLLHKVTKVAAKAGEDFVDLMGYMPDYLTANKVNTALKATVGETAGTEDDENEADTSDVKEEAKTEDANTDYESMSGKQLWDMLGKAGKRKMAKSTKKADLVEACKQAFGAGATAGITKDEEAEETEEVETETESEANPYEGKSAMDLFKECKKRGIKAAPKKPAKFYADLLVKADAEAAEENAEEVEAEEANEWDDEPAAEEAPKKAEKKASAKKEKEEAADDDDDWDI